MYSSQAVILFLLGIYIVCGVVMCYFLVDEECTNLHKLFSMIATMLVGFALLIFRLLRGTRTRIVKYIHLLIHVIAIVLFIAGFINSAGQKYYKDVHKWPGFVLMGAVVFQVLIALFMFTFCITNPRKRLYYAPFHDIIGIWLFLCLVGCCMGVVADVRMKNSERNNTIINCVAYFCFLLVVIVVLSPFFEWELVGYI